MLKISDHPSDKSLNYIPGITTNAESWAVSPNKHPKYKPGPLVIAEQLMLGRRKPKNLTISADAGVDAAMIALMFNSPQILDDMKFREWLYTSCLVLQYGVFSGDELAENLHGQSVVNANRMLERKFAESKNSSGIEAAINTGVTFIKDYLDEKIPLEHLTFADTKTLYKHGGLLVVEPITKGNDKYRQYTKLVKTNKLVIVSETTTDSSGKENNLYTFLRKSRNIVPGFYEKLKVLGLTDAELVYNDPTGIAEGRTNKSFSEVAELFRSI